MSFPTVPKVYTNNATSTLRFTSAMNGSSVEFLAFLSTFTQTYASDWNTQTVYGRNDPIATFRGVTRNLNIGWDVPAGSLTEAKFNLDNFSALTQMIYPSYSEGSFDGQNGLTVGSNALVLSKPPLIRMKFANLINDASGEQGDGLLGYITSLSWNPVLEMGMFTESNKLYPKVVALSISFGVLHEHDLGSFPNKNGKGFASFPDSAKFPFGGE
jgi:hypothetical protein